VASRRRGASLPAAVAGAGPAAVASADVVTAGRPYVIG
jgi:hypothetical protein